MWNLREWGTFIKKTFKGALWGVGVAIILFFYNKIAGLWNCFCDEFAKEGYLPEFNNTQISLFGFIICVAIGMIVGIVSATQQCQSRIKRQNREQEVKNYQTVCGRLSELTAVANRMSDVLVQHKKNLTFCGEACCNDINQRMGDCEELYSQLSESYEQNTNVKGEA